MTTHDGGKPEVKDVRNYKPPQGPIGIDHKGVGLGGDNHGCGCSGTSEHMSGSVGIGGAKKGQGSQR